MHHMSRVFSQPAIILQWTLYLFLWLIHTNIHSAVHGGYTRFKVLASFGKHSVILLRVIIHARVFPETHALRVVVHFNYLFIVGHPSHVARD